MKKLLVGSAVALFSFANAHAGTEQPPPALTMAASQDPFAKGSKEFQALSGAFFFWDTTKNNRPSVDYAVESLRLGIMLSNPHGSNFLAGNFEFLVEAFGGGIFQGPGNVLGGGTLFIRYNLIQPQARLIPYLQIGAGLVGTDIGESESRGLISLPVEFNLQGTVGFRYMMNKRWFLDIEGEYRHISNATIKEPNFGIDSGGGNIGFGFFF